MHGLPDRDVFLDEQDIVAACRETIRGQCTGGTAADHHYVVHASTLIMCKCVS